jgi:UDP-N-acetylmuramate: L-alanyl-gamma-D-glutamyl-meso-diaminopimelate ligase
MHIHIVGICGRVYAHLAKELVRMGHEVTGSDDRPMPPVSDFLKENNLFCSPAFSPDNLSPSCDLVLANALYGGDNAEIIRARELGIPVSNFARYLGERFLGSSRNIVVAGSYGKTTTSAMLAWIMESAGKEPGWLVGGPCANLGGEHVRIREGGWWVLEGDEYRTSADDASPKFRHYNPQIGVITALDYVHQDQFESLEVTAGLFRGFMGLLPEGGVAFLADTPLIREMILSDRRGKAVLVGFGEESDERVIAEGWQEGRNRFSVRGIPFDLGLRGRHSCLNAALAALAAEAAGVSLGESAAALGTFDGVGGRLETVLDRDDLTVISDLAIYPRSIAEVVSSVRESSRGRRFAVLFQPRYTLGDEEAYYRGLAGAFAGVDLLMLADAVNYPGIPKAFAFAADRLESLLPESTTLTRVGPAMKSFDAWRGEVRDGDIWLVMVEPLFPEPLGSIRTFPHGENAVN